MSDDEPPPLQEAEEEVEDTRTPQERAAAKKLEGNERFKSGRYSEAVKLYSEAIELDAQPVYYNNRAAANLMNEQYQLCIDDCRLVLVSQPDDVKAHLREGKAHLRRGETAEARRALGAAAALEPGNRQLRDEMQAVEAVEGSLRRTQTLLREENYAEALKEANKGLERSRAPNSVALRVSSAEALLGLRQPASAGSVAVGVLRDHPRHPDALYVLAMARYSSAQLEEAGELLARVLRLDPDHRGAREARKRVREVASLREEGNVHFKRGGFKEAHAAYSAALVVDPGNGRLAAVLHFNRALAGLKIGFDEQALADCNRAVALDPGYDKAKEVRLECLAALGRHRDVVGEWRQRLNADPSDRSVRRKLAEAEAALKASERPDLYAALGIRRSATQPEIKKAYKRMALKFHPDKNSETEESRAAAETQFKLVNEANIILSDPKKKAAFDRGADMDEVHDPDAHASPFGGGGFGGHSHSHGGGHPFAGFGGFPGGDFHFG